MKGDQGWSTPEAAKAAAEIGFATVAGRMESAAYDLQVSATPLTAGRLYADCEVFTVMRCECFVEAYRTLMLGPIPVGAVVRSPAYRVEDLLPTVGQRWYTAWSWIGAWNDHTVTVGDWGFR